MTSLIEIDVYSNERGSYQPTPLRAVISTDHISSFTPMWSGHYKLCMVGGESYYVKRETVESIVSDLGGVDLKPIEEASS